MKFNIKVTRERTFFKHLKRKSTIQQYAREVEQMATEHEKLAERCREISRRMTEMERKADSK